MIVALRNSSSVAQEFRYLKYGENYTNDHVWVLGIIGAQLFPKHPMASGDFSAIVIRTPDRPAGRKNNTMHRVGSTVIIIVQYYYTVQNIVTYRFTIYIHTPPHCSTIITR